MNKLIRNYVTDAINGLGELNFDSIELLAREIIYSRENCKSVFIAGNGGSASTSSHFATDLGVGSLSFKKNPMVQSLCDNNAVITATANDFGTDYIFSKQLETIGCSDDLLILISASGNSKNLLKALESAKSIGIRIFSLTGFDGGELKKLTFPNNIHIQTDLGKYGLVEDMHLLVCHVITECIRGM